ncbi:MAG: class I SAM-dependent methyltransferase [candidate division KSB1 bacterium]|nr:class I SAM-dependent methyltransferase [candidate division KSB1 bacterium]
MMFGYREWFTYYECFNCGCLQIAEIPADLSKYYPANYYSLTHLPDAQNYNPVQKLMKRLRDRYAVCGKGALGKWLYRKFPNESLFSLSGVEYLSKDTRILDVGCGTGMLLWDLRNLGFTNTMGVEPFLERDLEYANGLHILKRTFFEIGGTWDLIMFHHVLEHLENPGDTLQHAARLLASNGMCLIRTPVVPCYAWEHYGTNWVQLDAPRHLFIYSAKGIEILAQQASLKLIKKRFDSNDFQFWGSEQYRKDIPLMADVSYLVDTAPHLFSKRQIAGFKAQAEKLNAANCGDSTVYYLAKCE